MAYSATYNVAQYLIGKSLVPTSSDYRYTYFEEGAPLTAALLEMPNWYQIAKYPLWL